MAEANSDVAASAIDDVQTLEAACKHSTIGHALTVEELAFNCSYDASLKVEGSRRRLSEVMGTLIGAQEPQWVPDQSMGRLDITALMESRGAGLDVFEQWNDNGEDAATVEVVILCDGSSSMSHRLAGPTSDGLWTIHTACCDNDIPCTAIGYNTSSYTVALPMEPMLTPRLLTTTGGTNPVAAIEAALLIFQASTAKHKLLFTLTDGEWDRTNTTVCHQNIELMNRMGVKSYLLFLQGSSQSSYGPTTFTEGKITQLKADRRHHHAVGITGSPATAFGFIAGELEQALQEEALFT